MQFRSIVLAAALTGAATLQAANVTFQITYGDGPTEGFYDPTLGASRRAAFEYALGIWSTKLQASHVGEAIEINAKFDSLGGTSTSATLGQAGAAWLDYNFGSSNPAYRTNTYYPDPLANHLRGSDPYNDGDINATFNSDVDGSVLGATNWYYGTNATPGGNIDFVTVVLHEVGHGLGFSSNINSTTGAFGTYPMAYDRFLYGSTTGLRADQMTNAQRLAAITSGNLFWDGAEGVAANGGVRPEIYAPNPYESGSSVSHLDEAGIYAAELMSPMYSGPDHAPSAVELGMLRDMGWTLVPEPGIAGAAVSAAFMALSARRRKAAQ